MMLIGLVRIINDDQSQNQESQIYIIYTLVAVRTLFSDFNAK